MDDWGRSEAEFTDDILKRQPLVYALQNSDSDLYRMEIEDQMTGAIGQDPFLFHYNGVGHATYSSFSVSKTLSKLGIDWNRQKCNCYDSGVTAATDSLLGLKYIISKRDLEKEKGYVKRVSIEENSIYENVNALDLLIVSNDKIKNVSLESEKDIFYVQNNIWKAMTGSERDIFIKENDYNITVHNAVESFALHSEELEKFYAEMSAFTDAEESSSDKEKNNEPEVDENGNRIYPDLSYIEISFPAERDGSVYLYDSAAIVEDYGSLNNLDDAMRYIGTYKKGENVSARLYFNDLVTKPFLAMTIKGLYIYYSDYEILDDYVNILKERPASIKRVTDTKYSGSATVMDSQLLCFTIPYDKGWKLLVDGEETDTFRSADIFLSAKVTAGEHSFELEYEPPGLIMGRILSVVAAFMMVIQLFFYRRIMK